MTRFVKTLFGCLVFVSIVLGKQSANFENNILNGVEAENSPLTSSESSTSTITRLSSTSETTTTSVITTSTVKTTTRRECNATECGPHAISCTYDYGPRQCNCKKGYASRVRFDRDDQVCERCLCDDSEKTCTFKLIRAGYDSRKICECSNWRLIDIRGECRACDCGPNSFDCEMDDSNQYKKCFCDTGYDNIRYMEQGDERCIKCECGRYGISCDINQNDTNRQSCFCDYGGKSVTETGKCKECNCGIHSYSCDFEDGVQKCSCVKGYVSYAHDKYTDEICKPISGQNTVDPSGETTSGASGWKIGFYVTAVILAALIVGLLILIIKRSRN